MSDFWKTVETIEPGKGWGLFSPVHLIWLAVCVCCVALGALFYRRCGTKGRLVFRRTVASLIIANTIADQIFLIATGQWNLFHLPLHMCSLGSYVIMAHAFARKESELLSGLVYAIALPAATLALVSPNWSVMPMWNFSGIQSEFFHIMMIMYAVMLLAGGYVPSFVHIRKAVLPMLGVIAAIFVLNKLIDTDFLFMNGGKSVSWLHSLVGIFGIYGYLFIFPLIMALLWTAMFLPFDLHRIRKLKKARQTTVTP